MCFRVVISNYFGVVTELERSDFGVCVRPFVAFISLSWRCALLKKIYAVFDIVGLEMVGPLLVFPNDASARRAFQSGLTHQDSSLSLHPEDYSLHFLGTIDTESGVIVPVSARPGSSNENFGVQIVSGDLLMDQLRRRESNPVVDPAQLDIAGSGG